MFYYEIACMNKITIIIVTFCMMVYFWDFENIELSLYNNHLPYYRNSVIYVKDRRTQHEISVVTRYPTACEHF
jgi:hypothetical protein